MCIRVFSVRSCSLMWMHQDTKKKRASRVEMCLSQLSHFKEQSLSPLWAFWLLKEEKTASLETRIVFFFFFFWQITVECHVLSNSAWHTKARSRVEVHTTLVITSAGIQNISEAKKERKKKEKATWKTLLLHGSFETNAYGNFLHCAFTLHVLEKQIPSLI